MFTVNVQINVFVCNGLFTFTDPVSDSEYVRIPTVCN